MSSFKKSTKNPETQKWEMADWIGDYFGRHRYGVKFPNGKVYNPEEMELNLKED